MDKCAQCSYNDANCSYMNCSHIVYCDECIHTLLQDDKLSEKCPICSEVSPYISTNCMGTCNTQVTISILKYVSKPKYVIPICSQCNPEGKRELTQLKLDANVAIDEAVLTFANVVPEKYMKLIMLMLNKAVTNLQMTNAFKDCYDMIEANAAKNDKPYLFTSEQMTKIGTIMQNKGGISKNVLVALCMSPWKLSSDIFSYGLCYMARGGICTEGIDPINTSIEYTISCLKSNMDKWKEHRYAINS